jgi:hypothetical protein
VITTINTEINKLLTSEDMKRFLQGEGAEAKWRQTNSAT